MNIVKAADLLAMLGKPVYTSITSGGEYHCPCPKCGGEDRFVIWPNHPEYMDRGGRYWCRRCGVSGDGIQFLRDFCEMGFREACEYLSIDISRLKTRSRFQLPDLGRHVVEFPELEPRDEDWENRIAFFVQCCASSRDEKAMAFFAERGLSSGTRRKYRLGYNYQMMHATWSAPYREDVEEEPEEIKVDPDDEFAEPEVEYYMRVPEGHVIPNYRFGELVGLSVRTTKKGFPRYFNAWGSRSTIYIFAEKRTTDKPVIIVESALDGLLINQDAGDLVECVALGSASRKPDADLNRLLESAPFIIVALDNDEAGQKAIPWWLSNYRHAQKGIIPEGKDPGEYFTKGGDILTWVKALLPEQLWLSPEEFKAWSETLKTGAHETQAASPQGISCE